MRTLSKSKIIAFRQCHRRVWLEVHRPDLKADSAATEARFAAGNAVGDMARALYDPEQTGSLIDIETLGFPGVYAATAQALACRQPLFEAAFCTEDALALADVLLPVGATGWRLIEVKSSTSVKDVQRDDIAIQAHIARRSGLALQSVALAHINSAWTHPGDNDYSGLFTEVDLSDEAESRSAEAQAWIDEAQSLVARRKEPPITTGRHCDDPYPCGFYGYCSSLEPQAEHPITWLPHFKAQTWLEQGVTEIRDLDPEDLNARQQRVRACTLEKTVFFDEQGARNDLAAHPLSAYFLDFETIQFAVPLWPGTRPYQQIPFQYSVHHLSATGKLTQNAFLDLTGTDPSQAFAQSLVRDCGRSSPVFVYNAAFERTRIRELGERFPALALGLQAISDRIVDLLPIARARYYHPSQQGSWSIKAVLPAAVPELSYEDLEGVQDGGGAQEAYREAIDRDTPPARQEALRGQLLAYCHLDTYAMVRLWQVFAGRREWRI